MVSTELIEMKNFSLIYNVTEFQLLGSNEVILLMSVFSGFEFVLALD